MIWFISDHHFNHANILTFKDNFGRLIRPGFKDIEHMNEHLIQQHNKVVEKGDKVYFGGDIGRHVAPFLLRMNGRKRLILGNHDDKLDPGVFKCFDKVLSWRFFGDQQHRFVVSHYPLHPMSFEYRGAKRGSEMKKGCFNLHGHIHEKMVMKDGQPDLRYLNICVEKLDYTPISMEEVQRTLARRSVLCFKE